MKVIGSEKKKKVEWIKSCVLKVREDGKMKNCESYGLNSFPFGSDLLF